MKDLEVEYTWELARDLASLLHEREPKGHKIINLVALVQLEVIQMGSSEFIRRLKKHH